ncbi:class I SAM-dependent methyltransferase [Rossellomorea yichunensis]|uniref:class I SAM-dependent methyltransferase n=1 Tax=Rossellomorea yichunensis TaxID=3077331 RepID=UPI0028E03B1E|nr:class I SAM-dependent methyltransferase [Rossellomorea sp. YC4-1]MDT9027889.1 class I SAM-dependent methyltransferase [Rossellomorea sp. YC4-1]
MTYDNLYGEKEEGYYQGLNLSLLQKVSPQSTCVLEVGCAEGRLGASIQKQFQAKVYGIELYKESAEKAKSCLTDVLVGDIEEVELTYPKLFFDHILFGDVLEHLKDPWSVLKKVKPYLKENGSILACIPNVGHISILIELLAGNWNYTKQGLLDQTHLRFFTRKSILQLFDSSGYQVVEMENLLYTSPYDEQWISPLQTLRIQLQMAEETFSTDVRAYQYIVKAVPRGVGNE